MSGMHVSLPSVLFVDESNTRLGVMAEHVARQRLGQYAEVASAGFDVRESHASERAVTCLHDLGLVPMHEQLAAPRPLRDVDIAAYDVVVALSPAAAGKVPRAARDRVVVWDVRDPWQGSDEVYAAACDALDRAMEELLVARARATVAA